MRGAVAIEIALSGASLITWDAAADAGGWYGGRGGANGSGSGENAKSAGAALSP